MLSLLDDEDTEVVDHVEGKIRELGTGIIPVLETEWEENFNPIVQRRIEELIHTLQFELLKEKLSDWKEHRSDDLLEGMWLIATYQYPDLDFQKIKTEIDQIYYTLWPDFKSEMYFLDQIKTLNHGIFQKLKFAPNTKNFHSPNNSFINSILESKKSNPIGLCIIYMLIAQRLDMPVYGVNLPNLFVLTYKSDQHQLYINAFNKGLVFTKDEIDNYVSRLNLTPDDKYYEPCSNLDTVKRVLRNLIMSYEKISEYLKADEVKQLLVNLSDHEALPPLEF